MRVFCDFDGTIARVDTTDVVLTHYARPEWAVVEADWLAGRISAAQCMREQVALIQAPRAALDALLDTVPLDPGFPAFVRWAQRSGVPVAVVSDGVDYFIRRVLDRHGLGDLPIVANRLDGGGEWSLAQPWSRSDCEAASGVCKCAATGLKNRAAGPGELVVFVGDGRSDFCVSDRADLVFAKHKLAEERRRTGAPFEPFSTFHEVTAALARVVAPAVAPPGSPTHKFWIR